MKRNWMRLGAMPLLAAALWLTGCSDQGTPLAPADPPAVRGPSESLSLTSDVGTILTGASPDLAQRVNEVVIGPRGGSVYVSLHYLYVPVGAVSQPTVFRVELPGDGTIGAALTATSVGSSRENDVGEAGFRRPVFLTFSYAYATNPPADPFQLRVLWARPDGTFQAQPTLVNPFLKLATARLTHFSDYILAIP